MATTSEAQYDALLREAQKDFHEIDCVCEHGVLFAQTEKIENALALLCKWSDGAEEKYGHNAVAFLRNRGIGVLGKTERRKQELRRVLNLKRQASGKQDTGSTNIADKQHETPSEANTAVSCGPDTYGVQPVMASHAQSRTSLNGHPRAVRPESSSAPPAKPVILPISMQSSSIYSAQSPLFCRECQIGPLRCEHSQKLLDDLMCKGLENLSKEEKMFAKSKLKERPNIWSHSSKTADYTAEKLWSEAINTPKNQQQSFAQSMNAAPVSSERNKGDRGPASFPNKADALTGHIIDAQPSHSNNMVMKPIHAGLGSNHIQQRSDLTNTNERTGKRRVRQERDWCSVCKSNRYWCVHEKAGYVETNARPRPDMNYCEGMPDVTMVDSQDSPTQDDPLAKKRKRSEPTLRKSSRVTFRRDSYRDSGLFLTTDDEEDESENDQESSSRAGPVKRPRKIKGNSSSLQSVIESASHENLAKSVIKLGSDNPLIGDWLKNVLGSGPSLISPTSIDERDGAPRTRRMSRSQANATEHERQSRDPELNTIACRRCETRFDPAQERKTDECHYHDGDLGRKFMFMGHEKVGPVVHRALLLQNHPEMAIWSCCDGDGTTVGCKAGLHIPEPSQKQENARQASESATRSSTAQTNGQTPRSAPPDVLAHPETTAAPENSVAPETSTMAPESTIVTEQSIDSSVQSGPPPDERRITILKDVDLLKILDKAERDKAERGKSERGTAERDKPERGKAGQAGSDKVQEAKLAMKRNPGPPEAGAREIDLFRLATGLGQPSDAAPAKVRQGATAAVNERSPRAGAPIDTDYNALPDFCPPTHTLNGEPDAIFKVDTPFPSPMDLSNDPDRDKLHPAELFLAARLRLICASYLCSKRRIFQGFVEKLVEGKEYRKIFAQQACKVDARKARGLYSAFEQVGWFDREHFAKHLPDHQASTTDDPSASDTESLSSVDEQALISDGQGPPTPAGGKHGPIDENGPVEPGTPAVGPAEETAAPKTSSRKQKAPSRIIKHSPTNSSDIAPAATSGTPITGSFLPVNAAASSAGVSASAASQPTTTAPPPNPEFQQYRKSGGGDAKGSKKTHRGGAAAAAGEDAASPHRGQPGQRETMIVCPYPRSWDEADAVDRELVRLKRREGRQWPELFEWWRSMGRMSLKNAGCLAVRYSILKKKYEDVWEAEERAQGVDVPSSRTRKARRSTATWKAAAA